MSISCKNNSAFLCCIFDRDKAGGYGIQALGGMLVEYVQGDFLNVVGFPINHFCKELGKIYNGSPESPASKIKCKKSPESDGPCTSVSCLSEEAVQPDISSFTNSDSVHNVVEPEATKSNNEGFPHSVVELLDGFKASKVCSVLMLIIK